MLKVVPITPDFAISPALSADDFAGVAALGYRTVIGFVPDGENPRVLSAEDAAEVAKQSGLTFVHIPAGKHDLFTDEVISATKNVLESAAGPVLGACVSGQRAAVVWAATTSRSKPVSEVLEALSAAGLNFGFLRDDLETQSHRARISGSEVSRAA